MSMHASITTARIVRAVKKDDGTGICIACGKTQTGRFVEPDAERYTCKFPKCGQPAVYGAEQLLLLTVA